MEYYESPKILRLVETPHNQGWTQGERQDPPDHPTSRPAQTPLLRGKSLASPPIHTIALVHIGIGIS